jgi:signal transduction histidine kinase/CheY-like chemotaxis protein/tetratricopeptide (TPR) repeat protein
MPRGRRYHARAASEAFRPVQSHLADSMKPEGVAVQGDLVIAGRYRALRLLGEKVGVRTLLALDRERSETVVIKTLESRYLSPATRVRLEEECRQLCELRRLTPRPLLEAGTEGDNFYVVMPFLSGETLKWRMHYRRLSLAETLRVAVCLFESLRDLHACQRLHRNIKPSNIVVNAAGRIVRAALIDIGLAHGRAWNVAPEQQTPESVLYLSPEQTGSVDVDVGETSDLYSAGVVLYECLTGQPPFRGETVGEILFQHVTAPVTGLQTRGIEVPPVVDEVVQRLLRKDPRDRYQSAEGVLYDVTRLLAAVERGDRAPSLVLGAADHRRSLTEPAFVARMAECDRIDGEIRAACVHASRLVLVEGESGSGKTRLLREAARRAVREGMWVLRGTANSEIERRPFQVFDGILSDLVVAARTQPALAEQVRQRLGDNEEWVTAAFPRLSTELGWRHPAKAAPRAFHEMRQVKGVVQLLQALGTREQPAMIVLDDCQWCDDLTITLLERWKAAEQESADQGGRAIVMFAFRSEEVPATHRIRSLPATAHLKLQPLDAHEIRHLAESMAGPLPEEALDVVQRLSGGSPFMASAVLRGLVESRAMVADAQGWRIETAAIANLQSSHEAGTFLARRIELLPEHTVQLLSFAAVLGREFDLDVAAALTGRTLPAALAILEEARRRQLVWIRPDGYHGVFVHHKIRRVLLDRLSEDQRRSAHRAAAEYMQQQHPDHISDLAYHFDAAGDSQQALPYALEAAEQARAQYALEVAEQQFRIAQRGAPGAARAIRFRIAEGLGDVLMLRGRYGASEELFEEAATLADTPLAEAKTIGMLGELSQQRGDMGHAVDRLEHALITLGHRIPQSTLALLLLVAKEIAVQTLHTLLPVLFVHRRRSKPREVDLLAVRFFSRLAHGYWFTHSRTATVWSHLRSMNLAERYPPTMELARSYSEHAPAMTLVHWLSRGIAYARKALVMCEAFEDPGGAGQAYSYYGLALYAAGKFDACADACREAIRLLERTGDFWQVHIARFQYSCALYRLGRLEQALEEARIHHYSGIEVGDEQASGVSLDIWARAACGAVPLPILETEVQRQRSDTQGTVQVLFAKGVQLYYAGQMDEAADYLARANQVAVYARVRNAYTQSCLAWLLMCRRRQIEQCGDVTPHRRRTLLAEARKLAREALRVTRVFPCDRPHVLRECAYLAAMQGHPRRARRLIDKSLRLAQRQQARYEYAQSLLARGQIGRTVGWADAERQLEEANAQLAGFSIQVARQHCRESTAQEAATLSLVDRFGTVLDSGRKIAAALSPDAVFHEVRTAALHLLRGEHCLLFEIRQAPDGCVIVPMQDDDTPFHEALVERAVREGQSLTLAESPGKLGAGSGAAHDEGSTICVPIFQRGRPAACIYVTHRHVRRLFGPDEERLANFIATIAGAALENAEGFQQLQKLNETLEQRVADRTAAAEMRAQQLAEANAELERIARELLLTEEDLREAMQAAEAASLAKSQFLATVSHEIRTPMNGVIGMTELALQTSLNAQQRYYLTTLNQSADALMRLLNDILDISKIEAGKMVLESMPFDVRDVVLDATRVMMVPASKKGLELICRVDPQVPRQVVGDAGRLRQIIVNLVGNALKFTDHGEIAVSVLVQRRTPGNVCLHFSVQDTGIGIPADKQDRIFESFSQADISTTRRYGGTGLGLAISAQLVHLTGGRLWVESAAGTGSTFHFTAQFGWSLEESERVALPAQSGLALLLDCHERSRAVHRELLECLGWATRASSDAETIVRLLKEPVTAANRAVVVSVPPRATDAAWRDVEKVARAAAMFGAPLLLLLPADQQDQTTRIAPCHPARCLAKPAKAAELRATLGNMREATLAHENSPLTAPAAHRQSSHRILLAEDCLVNQEVAVGLLELQGHSVRVVNNGREAVDALREPSFDLVLMDVEMPELDGLEATRLIRNMERGTGRHTLIIAMTAHAVTGFQEKCLEAGMDGYISKPIDPRRLYQAMESLWQARQPVAT